MALKRKRNYEAMMVFKQPVKEYLLWWINHIPNVNTSIRSLDHKLIIYTGASSTGWGASCGDKNTHGF
ncbi:hypothetical protein NQ314_019477 [Rhamnusium bicolor]|uniref:Uncharacterized protein n=1 Tax=Rhamnusium bicolor TaxID=1586634 RepID=A0AAV8WPC4_9CUCU|nr:hypothetical protein NQ314_019477 [Rhamnusium bicolor]